MPGFLRVPPGRIGVNDRIIFNFSHSFAHKKHLLFSKRLCSRISLGLITAHFSFRLCNDEVPGNWFYLSENRAIKTGWFYDVVRNVCYYLKPNGIMAADEITPDGYCVNADCPDELVFRVNRQRTCKRNNKEDKRNPQVRHEREKACLGGIVMSGNNTKNSLFVIRCKIDIYDDILY